MSTYLPTALGTAVCSSSIAAGVPTFSSSSKAAPSSPVLESWVSATPTEARYASSSSPVRLSRGGGDGGGGRQSGCARKNEAVLRRRLSVAAVASAAAAEAGAAAAVAFAAVATGVAGAADAVAVEHSTNHTTEARICAVVGRAYARAAPLKTGALCWRLIQLTG